MGNIVLVVSIIIVMPLMVFFIVKSLIAGIKAQNHVKNTDSLTQEYCFVLNCSQTDALDKLSIHNAYDCLEYRVDKDCLTIVFSHLSTSIEHKLSFYVVNHNTYLKVSRVKFVHSRSEIPLMINRFFIEKIGAVPVDYSLFQSYVCSPAPQ